MSPTLIAVLGPTATGKTALGARLAYKFNGEILSADSRQVYRGMDIGTGKDIKDFTVNGIQIPYHLIDVANPSEEFNLYRFKQLFIGVYKNITAKGKIPIMVGGTGMYLSAIIQDYKLPEENPSLYDDLVKLSRDELENILLKRKKVHNKTDLASKSRMVKAIMVSSGENFLSCKFDSCVIGVRFEREEIRKRITARLQQRLGTGMIEEVNKLIENGVPIERLLSFGLEYKYITLHITGRLSYDEMFQKLNTSIHAFAKRQMTWFRKMEREGVKINWIEKGDYSEAEKIVEKFLSNES